jgi:ABC-type multidrug transport system permease subunit
MLNVLRDVYSVLWADLRNLKRHWQAIAISSLVLPLLYLGAFGFGLGQSVSFDGVSYLTFVIPGIISLTAFSASFNGSSVKLQTDRFFYKSFEELLMSPISLHSIVIGKALIGVVRGLISSAAILAVGLIFEHSLIISPLFVMVMFVSCFVFALFGVLAALRINSHQGMSTFNSVVVLPMTFLCGTFFSLSALPEAAKAMLYVLPLTHSSTCLRAAALEQAFPWLSFAALLGFGLAFFYGSMFVLKKKSV